MALSVCPAAVVAAPLELTWEIAQTPHFNEWIDGRVVKMEPEGAMVVGQTLELTSAALGRNWRSTFVVREMKPEKHQFAVDAYFPFGIIVHEHISLTRVDAVSCRVQYG